MNATRRKRYSAESKAKVALTAIKGEQTVTELGRRYGLHPNLIANWKEHAIKNLAEVFSTTAECPCASDDHRIREFHPKIGQLFVILESLVFYVDKGTINSGYCPKYSCLFRGNDIIGDPWR